MDVSLPPALEITYTAVPPEVTAGVSVVVDHMILKFVDKEYVRTDGTTGNILLDINDCTDYFVQLNTFAPQPASQTQKFAESPLADYKKLSPTQTKIETIVVPLEIKVIGDDEADLHDKVEALMIEMRRDEIYLMHLFESGTEDQDERYYECFPAAQIEDSRAWDREYQDANMAIISCNLDAKQPYGRWEELTDADFDIDTGLTPTKITIAPENVKGDDLALCDIYLEAQTPYPTHYILGERYLYSEDWEPVVEPTAGAAVSLATRRTGDYRLVSTVLDAEMLTDGGLEEYDSIGAETIWDHWTPERFSNEITQVIFGASVAPVHTGSAGTACAVASIEWGYHPGIIGRLFTELYTIDPTKDHIISAWFRRTGNESKYMRSLLGIHCHDVSDNYLGTITAFNYLPPTSWEQKVFFLPYTSLPAGTTQLQPYWRAWAAAHFYGYPARLYFDDMSMMELDRAVIEATFPIDSHRGLVIPTAGFSFDGTAAPQFHGVTLKSFIRTTGGEIISPSTVPQRLESDQSQQHVFTEMALLSERMDSIQIPTHLISDNADESTLEQVIQLETDPGLTDNFWYDEIALIPVDRSFVEVSEYSTPYLILDSHSKQILTSIDGTLNKAQVYDPMHTKGTPNFVIDPKGCNFTLLAVNSVNNDDQLNPVVIPTFKYRPVYRW
jgi:hypothetical protein